MNPETALLAQKRETAHAPEFFLRPVTFPQLFSHFEQHWNREKVRVQIAQNGQSISLPREWHGSEKYGRPNSGDALVLFGPVFVESIEGTELSAQSFIDGLAGLHFTFESGDGKQLQPDEAVAAISSDRLCRISEAGDEEPIFRAVKDDAEGKLLIEVRNGSMSPIMKELSLLGNDPDMTPEKKQRYRQSVSDCLGNFSAKGATAIRKRLGLFEYARLTRFDDCLASGVTVLGDQEVDDRMGNTRPNTLEEIRVAIASTQGIAIAIKRALDRHVPTLIRVGALSYGLGSKAIGANYLVNTQPEMKAIGTFTVGDMGQKLATGREPRVNPHIRVYGSGKNETRIYLGGGLSMLEIWEDKIREQNKTPDAVVTVLQASRTNPPALPDGSIPDWGVLLKGKHLPATRPPRSRTP